MTLLNTSAPPSTYWPCTVSPQNTARPDGSHGSMAFSNAPEQQHGSILDTSIYVNPAALQLTTTAPPQDGHIKPDTLQWVMKEQEEHDQRRQEPRQLMPAPIPSPTVVQGPPPASTGSVEHRPGQLCDNTICIVSEVFKLGLPSSKTPIQILDPVRFDVDGEKIPSKLKNIPKPGDEIYIPLHHKSSSHWTLCVLVSESDYEADSGSKSVRLDFYDSLEDAARSEQVKVFFIRWIKEHYPHYTTAFYRKKSAQQKDGTSCGIFVLETMRRFITPQDVTRTIKPMNVRENFLGMITSLDTNSPSLSTTLPVVERIKALHGKSNKPTIMASSPLPAQQPSSILPCQYIITQIRTLIVSEGTSITDQLSCAQRECQRIAEEEKRVGSELRDAEKELDTAIIEAGATEKAFNTISESTRADETVNPLLAGTRRQAAEDENRRIANDERNTHAGKARLSQTLVLLNQIHSAASNLVQADRDDRDERIAEAMNNARRVSSEGVERAKREVEELRKQVADLKTRRFDMEALALVCRGLSNLQQKDGGEVGMP
ncbi:hypothetical protein FPOA_12800 [Fusarium poae]|uniref:Ubiquitin-like protease family profile domain-containing protein n=1 Tax=Fusarium poae TaxID=36050 RepID=A0A1B8A7V6_FUSPO|nr:hypothetical protein FPOA_12800 [Fusarium poae]